MRMSVVLTAVLTLAAATFADTPATSPGTWPAAPATRPEGQFSTMPATMPAVTLLGIESKARKVVFVVDHSGSMLDGFDLLTAEIRRAVDQLHPSQSFGIVAFSEKTDAVYPAANKLALAGNEAKRAAAVALAKVHAMGHNDDLLAPFADAMKSALAMNPNAVFLVTDGNMSAELPKAVRQLNAKTKSAIHTIAFGHITPEGEAVLKTIAKENGGQYKLVDLRDLRK